MCFRFGKYLLRNWGFLFVSSFGCPQFERAIERGGCNVLAVGRYVDAHDFAVVSLEGFQRLPRFVGPNLNRKKGGKKIKYILDTRNEFSSLIIGLYLRGGIVAGGYEEVAAVLLVFDVRYETGVSGNRVDGLASTQIPDLG